MEFAEYGHNPPFRLKTFSWNEPLLIFNKNDNHLSGKVAIRPILHGIIIKTWSDICVS